MTEDYKTKFPIGSRWRTRDGSVARIERHDDEFTYPIFALSDGVRISYTSFGRYIDSEEDSYLDLIERIDTDPEPAPQPTAMTYEQGERIIKLLDDICGGIVILMQQGDKK